jgi:hypothetical protein
MPDAPDEWGRAAVASALAVSAAQGLTVTEPRIVGRGSNRIVWLRPAPIVARVMTGTAALHPDPGAWLGRELDVGGFLARHGAPIVPPAADVAPGPYFSRGLWLSLWQYVDVTPVEVSAGEIGGSLRSLHDALARYAGPLPARSAVLHEIDWLLAALGPHADCSAWDDERNRLAPSLGALDADGQPLHGDASLSNLLSTAAGPRWNDLEDVCCGSPAWDLVGLVDDARASRGQAFADRLLRGYGRDVDPALTAIVQDVQTLYVSLWHSFRQVSDGTRE